MEAHNQELYIKGTVEAIFFENSTNFYKVMLVKIKETNTSCTESEIVVTGTFGQIQEGDIYCFKGDVVHHAKYGQQFKVEQYEQDKPTSSEGMIHYLSSSHFPGIGKKTAEAIVDKLGENAIDQILENPDLLLTIPGLNAKKREVLIQTLRDNYGMEQAVIQLNQYGFGNRLAFAIYHTYKQQTLEIIQENPYQLVEDIEGVGFKKADQLAEKIGIDAKSSARIRAALVHDLYQHCLESGDTYLEAKTLLVKSIDTLEKSRPVEMDPKEVADELIRLAEEGVIIQEGTKLYEKSLYFSEVGIAASIERLLNHQKKINHKPKKIERLIREIESQNGFEYGESQKKAMIEAILSPFSILTGGPGTGKTTVINGLVTLYAELNGLSLNLDDYQQEKFPILLAAPTGRAAKRMNEMTGLPASTIHRLLGLTGRDSEEANHVDELEGGLIIVDELSMVDVWLAHTLLKAVPNHMQVIFVGDKDQLPSVGPGQVLTDLLRVPLIPKTELTDIYRQDDGSSIVSLAHDIKNGKASADLIKNQKDRSFIQCQAFQVESVIEQVVTRAKTKGFQKKDIQVLAPMYKGKAGIDELNQMMQRILNSNDEGQRKEVAFMDKVYRIGDKVLHLVNSPEINVFNGDIGEVVGIRYAKETEDKIDELILLFDDTEVTYKRNEWQKFTLAYACSIHKSQGSEFPMVILPLVKQHGRMLQRKLLYTAVTRSKSILILIGEPEAFIHAIESETIERQTMLAQRLRSSDEEVDATQSTVYEVENEKPVELFEINESKEVFIEKDYRLTMELITNQTIDPMIGMERYSLYETN